MNSSLLTAAMGKWKNLEKPYYLLIALIFVLSFNALFLYTLLHVFKVPENELGFEKFKKLSNLELFFLTVVVAPVIETLAFQYLPIQITEWLAKKASIFNVKTITILAISISTILFSAAHYEHSFYYALATIPGGILLAYTYINFRKRNQTGLSTTILFHALCNLSTFLINF
jgi:membrane protease YdiL (CAAX protease family)